MITLAGILLNYGGRMFSLGHGIPLWMDSLGTLMAAYALGPVSGAVVGFAVNVMVSFREPVSLVYGIVNVFVGITAGVYARRNGFRTFFSTTSYGTFLALGTAILSTILNLIFNEGLTTNCWGDAVVRLCREGGMQLWLASFIGEGFLEFFDKVVTVTIFWAGLSLARWARQRWAGPVNECAADTAEGDAAGTADEDQALRLIAATVQEAAAGEKKDENRPAGGGTTCALLLFLPAVLSGWLLMGVQTRAEVRYQSTVDFDSYSRTVYDAENGLVSGHATDVATAADGSLWIGSYAGLYRYDGRTFQKQNSSNIKSVNCLYTDDAGRIWAGTNDSGLVMLIDQKIATVANTASGLCADSIRSIVQAEDGTYYVGTSDYLERIRLSDGIRIIGELKDVTFAKSLAADDEGNVAAVSEDGTLFLIRDGACIDQMTPADSGFSAATFDEEGTLFAGTEDGLLIRCSIAGGRLVQKKTLDCGLDTVVNSVEVLKNGTILCLTDQGLFRLENGALRTVDTGNFSHSLQNMTVDYQGNLWIASSRDGLLELSDSAFRNTFEACGISSHLVNACTRWQRQYYIGCDDGLIILNENADQQIENVLTRRLDGVRIRYFAEDTGGSLYIATYGQGVIVCSPSGEIRLVQGSMGPGSRVRTLLALEDGSVAASGEKGISFLRNGRAELLVPYGDAFGNAAALCFSSSEEGLLAGTDGNGVFLIRNGKIAAHYTREDGLGSDVVLKIVRLEYPDCWVFVTSNSLCVLRDGRIRTISSFPYSNNYDILQGSDGRLYVTGSAGIYITSAKALAEDDASNALLVGPENRFNASLTVNSMNMITEDRLLLCTGEGPVEVQTRKLNDHSGTIRMKVLGLHVGNTLIPAEDGVVPVLSKDAGSVAVEAELINYSSSTPVIRYRLDGFETEWHTAEAAELSNLVYGKLPVGYYTFQLDLLDRRTGQVKEESTFEFQVEELLEDTKVFKVYLIGTIIAFAAWLAWFTTRLAMQRRALRAEREVEQARTRVAMGNKAVISIARALYAKDQRTGQHSYNVAYYSSKLAEAAGLSEKECQNLKKAALLHDIGKIAIPDAILNKPGKLTDEEYAVMKTHTTIGAEILSGFTLIDHVSEGAKYHHERYDGKGYPDGIAGEAIPLYGRIIAVADAYDAMTANRVYRAKKDMSFAADQIRKGRGTQFDPMFADLFLQLIEKGEVDPDEVAKMYRNRDPEEDILK